MDRRYTGRAPHARRGATDRCAARSAMMCRAARRGAVVGLWTACAGLVACSFLLDRGRYVESRTGRPAPIIFEETAELPGDAIAAPGELEGIWLFSTIEQGVRVDEGLAVPLLWYALFLKLDPDGRYELVYQAYWGTRNLSDPNMRAVDVRESGRFSLASNTLRIQPASTVLTERRSGRLATRTIAAEDRDYRAALDGAYLNIAGPCAAYQVEPICRQNRDVWYALRLGLIEWPVPPLTRLSTPASAR